MKIGIITLPLLGNYGGILQNYALQTVLKRMGHTVETIVLPWQLRYPLWRNLLAYCKRSFKKYVLRRKCLIFYEKWFNTTQPYLIRFIQSFVHEHISTRHIARFQELKDGDYDAFVVGSDQIWRPSYSYRPIESTYLSFAKDWQYVKRVAYAASFGTDKWEYTPSQTQRCATLLQLFDGVSVREEAGVDLCRKYLHCEAVRVLDPTMLLQVEDYLQLFEGKDLSAPRGELLTYVLDETPEKSQIIGQVS